MSPEEDVVSLEEVLVQLGVERLPTGGVRIKPIGQPWWVPLMFLGAGAGVAAVAVGLVWLGVQGDGSSEIAVRWSLTGMGILAGAGVFVGSLVKTWLTFSVEGLTITRVWPLGIRLKRHVPWNAVEGISMLDWSAAGMLPGLRVRLVTGREIRLDCAEMPPTATIVLPTVLEEAGVPERCRQALLGALEEQAAVSEGDREALAKATPPPCRYMEVKENSAEKLVLRILGGKGALATGCVLMAGVSVGLMILWHVGDADLARMPIADVIACAVSLIMALVAVYLFTWAEHVVADMSGLNLASGGWLWRRKKSLSKDAAKICRTTGGFLDDDKEHVVVQSGGTKIAFGSSLTPEARGWLEARLRALWDLKEVSDEEIEEEP
jgi:hypothetical protein